MRFFFFLYILQLERIAVRWYSEKRGAVSSNTKARFEGDEDKAHGNVQWQVKTGRIRIEDVETYTEEQLQWKNAARVVPQKIRRNPSSPLRL